MRNKHSVKAGCLLAYKEHKLKHGLSMRFSLGGIWKHD